MTKSPKTSELTLSETRGFFPHAAGLFVQTNWPDIPKLLAVTLAEHRVLEEQAPRIQELASEILRTLDEQTTVPLSGA